MWWSYVKNDSSKKCLVITEWSSLNNKLLIDARRREERAGNVKDLSKYHNTTNSAVTTRLVVTLDDFRLLSRVMM